jgi:glycine/D-amino acid oxidase-like deaminating enzyme
MTSSDEEFDIVIVGAGISGLTGAYELADEFDVLVVDRGQVASDATSRASGLISTPQVYPEYPELGAYAMDFFESFDGSGVFSYESREKLQPVLRGGGEAARVHATEQTDLGNPVHYYDGELLNERYPGVVNLDALEGYDGVLEYKRTGMIDPMDYALSLKQGAEVRGAEFRTDTEVTDILVTDDTVTGVETEYGTIEASNVVCAAGWRSRELLTGHVELPIRPFRWQAVELTVPDGLAPAYPMGSETSMEVYWRPINDDNLLVGGAPFAVDAPESDKSTVSEMFRTIARNRLPELLPGIEGAKIVREESCPTGDSATPDAMPILDAPSEAPDGLVVATGFQKGGIMTSPCTGAAIRSLVAGESAPFTLDPFRLDRFEDRSTDFDLVNIYTAFRDR